MLPLALCTAAKTEQEGLSELTLEPSAVNSEGEHVHSGNSIEKPRHFLIMMPACPEGLLPPGMAACLKVQNAGVALPPCQASKAHTAFTKDCYHA